MSSVLWLRTLSQGQGLGTQGRGRAHSSLSSRRLEDENKSSRTHHWIYLVYGWQC